MRRATDMVRSDVRQPLTWISSMTACCPAAFRHLQDLQIAQRTMAKAVTAEWRRFFG